MMATLKAEFRKLLTVRSTYIVASLALLLALFMGFYVEGWKGVSGSAASLADDKAVGELLMNSMSTAAGFVAIVAVLFMGHEYRHNMIIYTLTASNSRTKVLISKLVAILTYAIIVTIICGVLGVVAYYIGLSLRDVSLPAQTVDLPSLVGRLFFYSAAFAALGLLFTVLARNVIAAIAIIFMVPSTIEPLLGLLLKENVVYLPFAALQQVITPGQAVMQGGTLTAAAAMGITLAYLAGGWLITWWLFLKRDAS